MSRPAAMRNSAYAAAAMIALGSPLFSTVAAAQKAPVRPAAFAQCAICHKVGKGEPSVMGPNLWGVAGRKAGSTNFSYSPAMKASKIVWTKATLTAFIAAPQKVVPGTRMAYAGQKDPKAAAALADYLAALK